jgi:AraC family transcriptional regulator
VRSPHVPITMGTERFQSLETESFRITQAWFPPGSVLDKHTHDRGSFAVMLGGGFRTDIACTTLDCATGFAWTEPLGERHANFVSAEGARVVVLQPDGRKDELLSPMGRLFGEVHLLRHAGVVTYSRRIAGEIGAPDALSRLCVDALAVMLLADAARLRSREGNGNTMPGWLKVARDILHERWRDGIGLSEIAAAVGVHPVHCTRMFRRYYGQGVGTYVRKLRLDWAVRELEQRERPISTVAIEAGFSDQSHFTRECKRHLGVTPAEYRKCKAGAQYGHPR